MLPTWEDKYSIDSKRIDNQHKKLFELAAQAYSMGSRHISKEEIKGVLDSFFNYMKVHFKDEEEFMKSIGYPNLSQHQEIHQHIIHSLVALIRDIHNVNDMKEKLSIIAKNWLLEHILHEDMKIANWQKEMALKGKKPKIKEEKRFYYICGCAQKVHKVNELTHERIQKGANYHCKKCGETIVYQEH